MMRRRCAVSGQHASDVVRWITTKKPTQVRSYHARAPSSHESFRGIFLEPKGTSRPPMLAGTQIYEREILDYNHPRVAGVTSYVKAYVGVRLTFLTAGYATIAYATRPHHILPCHPMDRPVLEAYLQSKLVQAPLPVIHTLGSERDFEYLDYVATPRALEKLGEITDDALLSAGCSSDDGNGNGNGDGDDGNCDGDVEHGDGGRPRFDEEQRKKILSVMKDLSLLEVLELLEMCQEVPDEHIIVAAWQRLAAFCRNNDQILDQVLSDPSFNHFYTILTPSSFSSFLSLVGFIEANVAMGLGEDHRRQRNVFEAVAQKTAPQISSYSVEGLSGLLFSLSLAGVRDKSTYEIAQGRLLAHMRKGGSLGFSSLPRVITAYARAVDSLGLPAYELLDWLEVEAVKKIDTMGPTLVCDVLWGFVRMQYPAVTFYRQILMRLCEGGGGLVEPSSMGLLVWSLAKLGSVPKRHAQPGPWKQWENSSLDVRADVLNPHELHLWVSGYREKILGQMDEWRFLAQKSLIALAPAVGDTVPYLQPMDVSMVAWSYAKLEDLVTVARAYSEGKWKLQSQVAPLLMQNIHNRVLAIRAECSGSSVRKSKRGKDENNRTIRRVQKLFFKSEWDMDDFVILKDPPSAKTDVGTKIGNFEFEPPKDRVSVHVDDADLTGVVGEGLHERVRDAIFSRKNQIEISEPAAEKSARLQPVEVRTPAESKFESQSDAGLAIRKDASIGNVPIFASIQHSYSGEETKECVSAEDSDDLLFSVLLKEEAKSPLGIGLEIKREKPTMEGAGGSTTAGSKKAERSTGLGYYGAKRERFMV